ncbi:hypothetical protein C0J52_21916 [Blattella germanica]|nr:hypothetical protein C0J52_21916 [Blattella germanica]
MVTSYTSSGKQHLKSRVGFMDASHARMGQRAKALGAGVDCNMSPMGAHTSKFEIKMCRTLSSQRPNRVLWNIFNLAHSQNTIHNYQFRAKIDLKDTQKTLHSTSSRVKTLNRIRQHVDFLRNVAHRIFITSGLAQWLGNSDVGKSADGEQPATQPSVTSGAAVDETCAHVWPLGESPVSETEAVKIKTRKSSVLI